MEVAGATLGTANPSCQRLGGETRKAGVESCSRRAEAFRAATELQRGGMRTAGPPVVDPWEGAKLAARLQEIAGNRPVLYRLEESARHGLGTTKATRDAEEADIALSRSVQTTGPSLKPCSAVNRRAAAAWRRRLAEVDLAVELDVELEAEDLEPHRRWKGCPRLARSDRLGDRLLNVALGADAYHLQEFANAEIEGFFVHGVFGKWVEEAVVWPKTYRR